MGGLRIIAPRTNSTMNVLIGLFAAAYGSAFEAINLVVIVSRY